MWWNIRVAWYSHIYNELVFLLYFSYMYIMARTCYLYIMARTCYMYIMARTCYMYIMERTCYPFVIFKLFIHSMKGWCPLCIRPTHLIGSNSLEHQSAVRHVILFWFRANQSLLLLRKAVQLAEKQQIPVL